MLKEKGEKLKDACKNLRDVILEVCPDNGGKWRALVALEDVMARAYLSIVVEEEKTNE